MRTNIDFIRETETKGFFFFGGGFRHFVGFPSFFLVTTIISLFSSHSKNLEKESKENRRQEPRVR